MRIHPLYLIGGSTAVLVTGLVVGMFSQSGQGMGPSGGMRHDGAMYSMLETHREMIGRMQQSGGAAGMTAMDAGMWSMMRQPYWADMDRMHQDTIDGMLGRR